MFSAKEIRGRDKTLRRDREGHAHWPAAAEKPNVEDTPRLPAVSAGAHWHGLRKPNLHNKNKRPSSPSRQKLLHGEDRAGVMHLPHAYSSAYPAAGFQRHPLASKRARDASEVRSKAAEGPAGSAGRWASRSLPGARLGAAARGTESAALAAKSIPLRVHEQM